MQVRATEYPEVTDDIEIRYKWYKEIISEEGEYYPLSKITEEDIYDKNNYKYVGKANVYSTDYCSLPQEFYLIKKQTVRTYKKTYDASYILIENIDDDTDIKIYHNNKLIKYSVLNKENNQIKLNLHSSYMCGGFLFFIDTDKNYTISLYHDLSFKNKIITKSFENQKVSTPDETWITDETKFTTYINPTLYEENAFNKIIEETINCAFQEKYVYKYKVTKDYYDDNYYTNIEGYKKDEKDYKIYYKGEPIIKTIEVIKEKIVEVPKIEYSYIEKIVEVPKIEYLYKEKIVEVPKIEYVYVEPEIKENDSSKENTYEKEIEKVVEYKTKTLEKKVYKIPVYMYILLFLSFILVIILMIKINRKNVERKK